MPAQALYLGGCVIDGDPVEAGVGDLLPPEEVHPEKARHCAPGPVACVRARILILALADSCAHVLTWGAPVLLFLWLYSWKFNES